MQGLLLALMLSAGLPAGSSYTVNPARSTIRYTVVHKLHEVQGSSSDIEGKALVREDGSTLAQVRVPVATFRSGDANRDTHMLEVVQAGKFPFATVKVILPLGPDLELPEKAVMADGEIDFHGVKKRTTVPITFARQPDGSIRARGSFDVSLDAHGVERPSLLFVKVDDSCRIHLDLELRSSGQ
jgi:polyisoprenoid-binding protein YceI